MPLTQEQSRLWQAMQIGPQWILRSSEDPLVQPEPARAPSGLPTATTFAAKSSPTTQAAATSAPRQAPRSWGAEHGASVNEPSSRGVISLKPAPRLVMPTAAPEPPKPKAIAVMDEALAQQAKTADWEGIKKLIASCHACTMSSRRTQTVPSDGAPGCPLVIVGEAPGRDEDFEGVPFVGKSGRLLNNILDAVDIRRGRDAAVINVLKCRPPMNRDPDPAEAAACRPFLLRQLELLSPKVLLLLGKQAAIALLPAGQAEQSIYKLRGHVFEVEVAGRTVKTMVSFHPSYLLRNPVGKEASWHDLLAVKKLLASEINR